MTLEELYMLEEHAETGFVACLTPALLGNPSGPPNIYPDRSIKTDETPRIELKVIFGEPQRDHEFISPGNPAYQAYDTYVAELQVTAVTNRTSDKDSPSHTRLLGRIRANLLRALIAAPPIGVGRFQSPVLALMDCWEQGTIDSVSPAENIDSSTISWFLFMQIKPSAWPETLNS